MKKFVLFIGAGSLIGATLGYWRYSHTWTDFPNTENRSEVVGPVIIDAILRDVKFETVRISPVLVVKASNRGDNSFSDYFVEESVALLASGTVQAGFDGNAIIKHYQVRGKSIIFDLGKPEITSISVRHDRSQIISRDRRFFKPDPELETRAWRIAEKEVLQAVCDRGILREATHGARAKLQEAFSPYFSQVTVVAQTGKCQMPQV